MSSGYYRHLRCTGCSQHCAYYMFRPLTGDYTLGRRRNGAQERRAAKARCNTCNGCRTAQKQNNATFREQLRQLFSASDNPADWRYKRRRTILGLMHAVKFELWESLTASCPAYGLDDTVLPEQLSTEHLTTAAEPLHLYP